MASGLYKHLVREWRNDASAVTLPRDFRELKSSVMHVRNAMFSSRVFRKVHIEHVHMKNMDIVHHTAFPKPWLDLPILGMDVIFRDGTPSMVIADVSSDHVRDPWTGIIPQLLEYYEVTGTPRTMPAWGRDIFSDDCLFWDNPVGDIVTPLKHLQASYVAGCEIYKYHERDMRAFHEMYCDRQLRNKKTRGLLTAAFGWDFADRYMREVMFDGSIQNNFPSVHQ